VSTLAELSQFSWTHKLYGERRFVRFVRTQRKSYVRKIVRTFDVAVGMLGTVTGEVTETLEDSA
jgi:hypothetical protein